MIGTMPDVSRRWIGVAACVVTALVIAVVIAAVVTSRRPLASLASAAARPLLPRPPDRPFLMFISLASDDTFKRVVLAPLAAPDEARYVTPLNCERVYYSGSRGLCLETRPDRPGVAAHFAHVFDEHFTRLHTLPLTGPPSRARLSPDGRRAAFTVFDEGHSYADGVFSTRTTIIDTIGGTVIGDLESWKVTRDGQPFSNRDFNFWGVTFAPDGNTFFATLRTQGSAYLIEGNVDAREARVVMQGAECPSLAPDHTRIAFKKRVGGSHGWWQLSLFDVSTRAVRTLSGDTESVDDQVEWLDNANLIYFRPSSDGNIIWRLRTDVDAPPQPFVRAGFSPAVVR
jgi:hypothetical protein